MLGGGGGRGGCHGIKPKTRVSGKHERFTSLCGFGGGEDQLSHWTECRGPGANPAPALVLPLVLADQALWQVAGPLVSLGATQ